MATDVRSPLSDAASHNGDHIRWAAISGIWKFSEKSTEYVGPSDERNPQSYGLAVTDQTLTDGLAKVSVCFSKIVGSAGLLLGFSSERSRYVVVQVGGYGRGYSVAEFEPGVGWQQSEGAGSSHNLTSGRHYVIEAYQTGQRIQVKVDGVPVLQTVLSQPLTSSQVGLFAYDREPVSFKDFTVRSDVAKVFVAMQFGEPFNTLYKEVILPKVRSKNLNVIRIDEVAGPGIIFEDIKRQIAEAKIVIAEITAPNQNVFYELGYAHALNKPTVLLAQRGKELPFDIRSYRVIFYDDSIGGKPALERNLEEHLDSILRDS